MGALFFEALPEKEIKAPTELKCIGGYIYIAGEHEGRDFLALVISDKGEGLGLARCGEAFWIKRDRKILMSELTKISD
ncbi:MAG: hypothetical protein LBT38_12260 [Deltaproteobacteria bacterium]|nr:hypothetical protein [Deltaproteobacteria bacterium]